VQFVDFLLGFILGICILFWQRSRYEARLRGLLRRANRDIAEDSPFSLSSQLAMTLAQKNEVTEANQQRIELYRQIVQQAPVGFLQVDEENCLIWANTQGRTMLGIPSEDSGSPRLLLELVRSFELDDLIEQARRQNQACQKDWTFYPASDDPTVVARQQPRPLRGYAFPLSDRTVGIYLVSRQEAVMLKQQRDRWTSDVAHELKTPLTSIRLVAETLHGRIAPPMQGWIERLINETTRLSNLSLLERESSRCLNLKTVNLTELVHSAWVNLEPLASKKNIRLEFEGDESIPVEVDESRIYRALLNVLDNSIKYSPPRQCVLVQVSVISLGDCPTDPTDASDPDSDLATSDTERSVSPSLAIPLVCIDVVDSGPGFTEDSLPYVFDRFFREDPSRSRYATPALPSTPARSSKSTPAYQSGSGLGLSIVQQIVEAHHGKIEAYNHPDTNGAWIQIHLPQQQPSTRPPFSRNG
jgi:two-component system, OmpR family, phosphate regulon sensor histidine kinase PhoR